MILAPPEHTGNTRMSAQSEIAKALRQWLTHQSWYSAHPVDEGRFYRAMAEVIAHAGTVWTDSEFAEAIYDVIGRNPKAALEEYVHAYTSIAMRIRDYETVRPDPLFAYGGGGSYARL
ncbi:MULTISPECIES: hypothetical protein [Cupriavidus]|uniref:Uncharacterized protein n=1 Tax=Cupriavidus oxalaticus TaxID=96344 RepID=A0A4P7LAX3_9BURK|nr:MULTISPECIES: hypothetical protein [Cupriavidus]QBY53064.1 hypothetical protein E0W60_18235 [Cupriavidus oxalaticus]TDF55134.1 hypothetical protein E1J61_36360 [Cupriavidus sp. L7L]